MKSMIKRIIHISDIHIRTNQYHELYKKQFQSFLDEIKEISVDLEKEELRIVIAGDLFHQKIVISNEQLLLGAWFLSELSYYGIVIIIPGNHDFLEKNQERVDSITPIVELLNNPNIRYYKDSGVYVDDGVKWIVYSLYQHNQRPYFTRDGDDKYIGLFHGPIQGFSTNLGYVFEDGCDKLNFLDLDIVMCGDTHSRQMSFIDPKIKKTPIIQVGSFIQQDYAETVKHHGYGIYDVETGEYVFHDIPNEQPFMHFRINDIKDIEDGKESLINAG